ncbi:MAG: ABC transporter permease [Lachnospiraceae bacterium]|jgi:ribose transport system permease protein|nr:ABC transporter permease [Lachnospiraceae bacterium]MCI9682608.1 ABC transporter permease [Lachnospiraceae bacterium]
MEKKVMQGLSGKRLRAAGQLVIENLNWVLLAFLILFGMIFTENFFTWSNISNVLRQVSINGVLAAGFTIVILADGFDLSIGSIISICAVAAVGTLNSTRSPALAVVISLAIGLGFGIFNGVLIRLIKGNNSDSFLITLGTMLIASSCAYTYSGGFNIYCDNTLTAYRHIGKGSAAGIPVLVLIMFFVMAVFELILQKTALGRKLKLSGSNRTAVYMSGINAHGIKLFSFAMTGLCAGIAAIMLTARTGVASPSTGYGYEVDAATAAIIGGNREGSIRGNILKTLTGVLILGLITNIMNIMNISTVIQTIAKGIILLLTLYTNRLKKG